MISRRTFLEQTATLTAVLAATPIRVARAFPPSLAAQAPPALRADTLASFVDPLPLPAIARPAGARPDPRDPEAQLPFYRMPMRELLVKVHRDLPPTRVWGFGESSPGPLFDVRSGQGILIEWINELPGEHILPIDHTIMGAGTDVPEVRAVVHLHGGRTPPESDGYPEDWYVPGTSRVYHYPNQQDAALLFYHDHTMGINRLNIYAGLQGLYIVRDATEDALSLPRGEYELPIVVYDRSLRTDGQLDYPVSPDPKAPWVPECYGDAMLANGVLRPYHDVEPRAYRLRLMNGANARLFRFSIGPGSGRAIDLRQIGSDQGLLAAPVTQKRVLLAPAERADLLVDFSAYAGEKLVLRSDSFPIVEFRVAPRPTAAAAPGLDLPAILRPVPRLAEASSVRTRRLTLNETMDKVQQSMGMLLNNTPWHMPVTEKPVLDTTEIWELVNVTEDSHPIHLHLVRFQLLDRRPFDVFEFLQTGEMRFTGVARPAPPGEAGWKDTVLAASGEVTRIIIPFAGYAGRYVWHCHLLEHEDNEMMRPYEVLPAGRAG